MKDETESSVNKECESEVMMEERDIWGKFQARYHGEVRNSQRKKLLFFSEQAKIEAKMNVRMK